MKFLVEFERAFGPRLSDGAKAVSFRTQIIDPELDKADEIIFDFTGVSNANSSFMNALLSPIVQKHGEKIVDKIRFKGCKPAIKILINSALYLGSQSSTPVSSHSA